MESETDLDFARLVVGLDDDALPPLVPDIRREELPAPVFAAQVCYVCPVAEVGWFH
jgi:hypothetical protein